MVLDNAGFAQRGAALGAETLLAKPLTSRYGNSGWFYS